jgi:HD superfamily phosphohydrolase YqeK
VTVLSLDDLRAEAARRLSGSRLAHVEAVARTVAAIAAAGGWSSAVATHALRAAWLHDAWKDEPYEAWIRTIESAGWKPDPWSVAHGPHLLHAEAAAAWASAHGEADADLLAAVRHHPTGHPTWGPVGKLLYVADFCEPTRSFADEMDTAGLRSRAGEGEAGLAEAARRVLALRLEWLVRSVRPIHPASWETWNEWAGRMRRFGPRSAAP